MSARSTLFTPASDPSMILTALDGEADAVTLDLEDAVAPDEKMAAREALVQLTSPIADADPVVGVRINPLDRGGGADLDAVADVSGLSYIILPKVECGADVEALSNELAARDVDAAVRATVESPLGVERASEIADSAGLAGLGFGAEDFAALVGATRTQEGSEVSYARQRVVLAAAIGGVPATDTVYTALGDLDGLRRDAERALQYGFTGKAAIHPEQVAVINDVFTPSRAAVRRAARITDEFEAAKGSVVEVDGRMIDRPLYLRAQATLDRARAAGVIDADRSNP